MSSLSRRFLVALGLFLGLVGGTTGLLLVGQWLAPAVFGPLPSWLPEDTLQGLLYHWESLVLDWVPASVFSALILACSFWLRPEELPERRLETVSRFAVLAITASMAFAGLTLLAQPWLEARLADLEFRQTQARHLEDAYLEIKARGSARQTASDLEARLNLLKRLGLLRPEQNKQGAAERFDYDFELQILKAHFDLDEFFRLRALPGVEEAEETGDATVEELLAQAEKALGAAEADQEYQANLWGYQAWRRLMNAVDQGKAIPGASLDRAKAVVTQSWERIYERTLASDERRKASYFFRKGKSLGDYQFQNYLEAYYGFRELREENPGDPEVLRYWELSQANLAGQILFRQDMEVLFSIPGSERLVFRNRTEPLEIVRIGKLLDTSQGVYLRDFEFLRMDGSGKVLLHWTAPYGKWDERGIDFRVWEKDSPVPRFPQILTETPGHEFNPGGSVDPPLFQPRVTVQDLAVVNAARPRPQTLGTMDLLVHGQAIEALGYNSRLVQTEFVVRIGSPFLFFVAFFLVFSLAWVQRARTPARTWWFLVPLLPFVVQFVVHSGLWLSRLSVGGLIGSLGLEGTVLVLAASFVTGATVGVIAAYRSLRERS